MGDPTGPTRHVVRPSPRCTITARAPLDDRRRRRGRRELDWFVRRPLFGRPVAVTRRRSRPGPGGGARAGRRRGGEVPTIEIVVRPRRCCAARGVSTSRRTTGWCSRRRTARAGFCPAPRRPGSGRCAPGRDRPGTAAVLAEHHLGSTSCPIASSPSAARGRSPSAGRGSGCCCHGPRWPATCCPTGAARGWTVEVVEAYRTVPVAPEAQRCPRASGGHHVHVGVDGDELRRCPGVGPRRRSWRPSDR